MGKKILIGVGIVILILVVAFLSLWVFVPKYFSNDYIDYTEEGVEPTSEPLTVIKEPTEEERQKYEAETERRLAETKKEVLISTSRRIIYDPPRCGEKLCESEQSNPIESAIISLYNGDGDLIGTQDTTLAKFENIPLGEYSYLVISPEFGELRGNFTVESSIRDTVYVQADFTTTE